MIRSPADYRAAFQRLAAERQRLRDQDKDLRAEGLSPAARKRVLDPLRSFHAQPAEEVASYERLQRGDVDAGLARRVIRLSCGRLIRARAA